MNYLIAYLSLLTLWIASKGLLNLAHKHRVAIRAWGLELSAKVLIYGLALFYVFIAVLKTIVAILVSLFPFYFGVKLWKVISHVEYNQPR